MAIRKMSADEIKNGNVGDQRIRRLEEMLANGGGGQPIRAVEQLPGTLESGVVYVLVEDDEEDEEDS